MSVSTMRIFFKAFYFYLFIFFSVLGPHCYEDFSCSKSGLPLSCDHRLLTAAASPVAEHNLQKLSLPGL